MLATPGGAGPHNGFMQARHKVCQVAACGAGCRHAAVEPLLGCKLIYAAHKLDGHLRPTATQLLNQNIVGFDQMCSGQGQCLHKGLAWKKTENMLPVGLL